MHIAGQRGYRTKARSAQRAGRPLLYSNHNNVTGERPWAAIIAIGLPLIVRAKLTIVRPDPMMGTRSGAPDLVTLLLRARSGGRHIGPGDGTDAVELVDVRDVADFLAASVGTCRFGNLNLTGTPTPFRAFLEHCNSATASSTDFVWIPRPQPRATGPTGMADCA